MMRFCGQDRSETHQVQDFPVFNGKYSTTCYIDETLHALADMYERRDIAPAAHLRDVPHIFMHRPYRRMPENGLAVAWMWALARGGAAEHAELSRYTDAAGIPLDAVLAELLGEHDISALADAERLNDDAMPLTMGLIRTFRASDAFADVVLDKLGLGSERMRDLGNLYTAALPAWMAAGFEEALERDLALEGREILTLGYGSGDAAEVIPMTVACGWRDATARMQFSAALDAPIDLTQAQYEALHDGRAVTDLPPPNGEEFFVTRVGREEARQFQDIGIEYYHYQA